MMPFKGSKLKQYLPSEKCCFKVLVLAGFILFIKSQITTICCIDAIPSNFEDYIEKAVQLPGLPGVGKCGLKS